MKRIISLLLAVVMTLAMFSGLTMAADNTVEVKLRKGITVDASTPEDFLTAYKAVWAPGSNINRIRIMDNYSLFTAGLRTSGGHDPWMSGFENELCIRMPEGTCLDLNGNTVAIRANQGLDDNGTGKASGLVSMGTVIDTFGGGGINLQSINDVKYLQHAIDLAKKYPGIVKGVTVSKAMPGAENYEFTIPAGVTLRFSGKPSHLPAKKVTLEPGATVYKAVANAPGFEGCKAVVLQYVDDADMNRMGSEFATEKVKVEGKVPVYPKVNYKLVAEGGGTAVNYIYRPSVTASDVKTINAPTDATSDAAVILNPAGVKLWEPRKLTEDEIRALVLELAVAYYYQSNEESHIQYDGRSVAIDHDLQRQSDEGRPEDAAFDSTVYSVCSNYCWKSYRKAFGTDYNLFRMTYARTRTWSDFDPAKTPELVYQYTGPDCKNSKGETDIEKARVESRKVVLPGDILVHSNLNTGHALLFVGPIFKEFGDNTDYILHCKGSSFDSTTGQDKREAPGQCINLMVADESIWGGDVSWSFTKKGASDNGFAILRPYLDPAFPELPTQEGMCRLQFPRMKITRDLDRYKFEGVQNGEEVPVYVTITNNGSKEMTEVPVEEYIPAGTTYVEGSASKGAKIEGSTIKWAVKIPAGKSITLTYKVKVSGKLGDVIDFKGGYVGGIQSRSTSLTIGGKPLTDDQMQAIYDAGMKMDGKPFKDLQFFNQFYADTLGVDIGLPKTAAELINKLTTVKGSVIYRAGTDKLDKMVMPLHYAGQYYDGSGLDFARVREFKREYYQPGDIFVTMKGDSTTKLANTKDLELYMYLGDARVLVHTTKGTEIKTYASTLNNILSHNLILTLRPTFAYEDLNTRTVKEMAFTDVTQADWFYTYVEEMFKSGIINGMTETTFAPKGNLTWGQALKLVALAVGESEQAGGAHWASGYLTLAKNKKWLTKDVDLNANITRLDFCKVAAKAKGLTEMPAKNPFTDTASREVMALYHAGIINGMTETTFAPKDLLTRAQISKIIALLVNL